MKEKVFSLLRNPRKMSFWGGVIGAGVGLNAGIDRWVDHAVNYGAVRFYQYKGKTVAVDQHLEPKMSDIISPTLVCTAFGFFAGRYGAKGLSRILPEVSSKAPKTGL